MRRITFIIAVFVLGGCTISNPPALQPVSHYTKASDVKHHRVEVTMLGRMSNTQGVQGLLSGRGGTNEVSVSRPCKLIIHLPSGKTVSLRTRPILFINCPVGSDIVTSVFAPPEGEKGTLIDKVREIKRLMAKWHVVPDDRMRNLLKEWSSHDQELHVRFESSESPDKDAESRRPPQVADPFARNFDSVSASAQSFSWTRMRARTHLDEYTDLFFRITRSAPHEWELVLEIEAKPKWWKDFIVK